MSEAEAKFLKLWRKYNPDLELLQEVKFHPSRRWRFDFAHDASSLAIEIEGGIWVGGRHTRGAGFQKDCEKYLAAALRGWNVVRITPAMVKTETVKRLGSLMRARLRAEEAS